MTAERQKSILPSSRPKVFDHAYFRRSTQRTIAIRAYRRPVMKGFTGWIWGLMICPKCRQNHGPKRLIKNAAVAAAAFRINEENENENEN